jgi:multiple sugar transport system substrate-binding protein
MEALFMKNGPFRFLLILPITFLLALSCAKSDTQGGKEQTRPKAFAFQGMPTSGITFLSTQMNPVEEAGKMRNSILKDFPGKVDFQPNDNSFLFRQTTSMLQSNPSASILLGALHGDLVKLYEEGALRPMNDVYASLGSRTFSESLMRLSKLDGKNIYYIPWMQASFVMVANKKALAYLPRGADLNELRYDQLERWASEIYEKTGRSALGFPAGGKGLMHRFFQGYLYPSYTASTLLKFRGPDAIAMWGFFKGLWRYVNPGSLVYSTMAEPLLTDDVWIAWDHSARLMKAFEQRPSEFVAFPSPIGPKGRGFMSVVSGLSIPKRVADFRNPAVLIDYLTQSAIQDRTLIETGFFPVLSSQAGTSLPLYLRSLSAAVGNQAASRDAVPTLVPVGLGERADDYNKLFMMTFSQIVLEGRDASAVLNSNAVFLQSLIDEQNVKCWLPDVSEERPCKIE